MEVNEYEKKLWASLEENEELEKSMVSDMLTDAYGDVNSEYTLKRVMIAVSYFKRLIISVMDKRGIRYDVNEGADLSSVVNSCIAKYDELVGLDVSNITDEKLFENSIGNFVSEFDYDQLERFSTYFKFLFSAVHDYMAKHIAPLLSSSYQLMDEISEPVQMDAFLSTVFEGNNNDSVDDELWPSDDDWGTIEFPEDDYIDSIATSNKVTEVTDEQLREYLKFLNSIFEVIKMRSSLANNHMSLANKVKAKKIDMFFSDKEFMQKFRAIMEHDTQKHNYRFHGTACLEDAKSICEQGLGVMRDNLDSTSYSELSMEDIIVRQRGFGGEIGRDAYVIIDEPIGIQILESISDTDTLDFVGSGLQGLDAQANNIVRSKYIVGYVDKLNRDIVFNPEYYGFERFAEFTAKKKI